MVHEYEELTWFFPTKVTKILQSVDEYEKYYGDLEDIRFSKITKEEVLEQAKLIWNKEIVSL